MRAYRFFICVAFILVQASSSLAHDGPHEADKHTDASNSFQKAQKLDPDFAMAYRGEAMTHNGPVWDMQFLDRGVAALNKFAPTAEERKAKLTTDLERDYFAALEILYGEGTKPERDARFLIHGVDDPTHAPLGLEAARALYEMAPDAGHYPSWLTYAYVQNGEPDKALDWLKIAYQKTTEGLQHPEAM